MGSRSRRKGAQWERDVCAAFASAGWAGGRAELPQRGLGQARAADEVPDADVHGLWPECKAGAQTNPRAALAQAVEASARSGRVPLAVCKDDRRDPFVVVRLDDFLRLVPPIAPGDPRLRRP